MGLFTDEQDTRRAEDEAIARFWQWWASEGKSRATAVFDDVAPAGDTPEALAESIEPLLEDLGLAYETGPGTAARHLLVFTPAGDPDLVDAADRWLAAAPPADDAFEYDNRRHAVSDPNGVEIAFADQTFDLASARVLAEHGDHRVHVHVMHDEFEGAPEEVVQEVVFMFLDVLLGERLVEDRIGAVTYGADHRTDEIPLIELPGVITG